MSLTRLRDLINRGHGYEVRFEELTNASEEMSAQWPGFINELREWLTACVHHGRYLPPVSADRRALQGQVDYWTSRLLQAGHPLPEFDRLDDFDPGAGLPLPKESFPYYGLVAVTEEGTQRFFGRDEQIKEYVAHLEDHKALLIQSESGGGKSSVAMAGVIPELRRRHRDWLVAPQLTPGAHPCAALGDALAAVLGPTTAAVADARAMLAVLGTRSLLVFIDQLEELVTVCTDESEQALFCALLAALAGSERVRLLATLRSDHYDRLASSQACRPLFVVLTAANSVKTLPPMSFEQIRSVILKPAQAVGLRYVPASLVDRLANETANLAGGLPRLQFALQRLWELRPNNEQGEPLDLINEASFAKLPNVREALGTVAQGVFENLSPGDQRACERLMLELTLLDDQLEVPLRRRRLERDLIAVLTGAKLATEAQALELVRKFVDQRLLVRTGEGDARQIEVAHESLFRYWPQFRNWINSDKARSRLKDVRQIACDALQWEQKEFSPDYLKLKGVPLENAKLYRDENWLDAASRRYCDACEAAVRAQDELDRAREQEARRARNEIRAAAEKAKFDAVQRQRARRVWLRVGVGSSIVLVFAAGVYNYYLDKRRVAATNTFASLISQLDPLEAFDLAYTLEKNSPGDYVAPLAHALDRLTGSEVVAERNAGADFSPSGRALTQLARDRNSNRLTVRIVPIEADGSLWPEPATIDIVEDAKIDGILAALDVGPPIPTAAGTRLVVMSFVNPPKPGEANTTFGKLVAYSITRGATAKRLFDRLYPAATSRAPNVSFDVGGESAAVASLQSPSSERPPQGEVILLRKNRVGGIDAVKVDDSKPTDVTSEDDRSVVTAVAYTETAASAPPRAATLITGRLDGSVFCGETRIEGPDRSPVVGLRAAGPGPWFVALHGSNKLVVGRCGVPNVLPKVLKAGLTSPQSLILRFVTDTGADVGSAADAGTVSPSAQPGLQLSFTDGRKLCNITWPVQSVPKAGAARKCWVPSLAVDQAVPVFAVAGKGTGDFLTLPDRRRSWVVKLNGGLPSRGGNRVDAKGVPVALLPDVGYRLPDAARRPNRSLVAASPNQKHLARITVTGATARVERQQAAGEWIKVAADGKRPIAVTLNDQGVLAVLENGSNIALVQPGGAQAVRTQLGFDGACLKLTPDGHRALVAGSRGETTIIELGAREDSTAASDPQKKQTRRKGAGLTACAVGGDDDTTVSGFSDGTVIYARPKRKLVELSKLVQFRLPSGAQDVSIDATGQFVAVLGNRAERICLAGAPGYPVRIWDVRLPGITFPVASGCLPDANVVAIGPLERHDADHWVLPVFEESGSSARRFDYDCLACGGAGSNASAANASIIGLAEKNFQPKRLKSEAISALYGIEP